MHAASCFSLSLLFFLVCLLLFLIRDVFKEIFAARAALGRVGGAPQIPCPFHRATLQDHVAHATLHAHTWNNLLVPFGFGIVSSLFSGG